MSKSKLLVGVALGLAGAFGAGVAQARGADVQWSISIGMPVFMPPVPVYVQPVPVYTRPAPVWVQPAPVYYRTAYLRPTRADRDGDGIPNRHDHRYNPQWDRDGDGVPNRYDRQPRRWQDR